MEIDDKTKGEIIVEEAIKLFNEYNDLEFRKENKIKDQLKYLEEDLEENIPYFDANFLEIKEFILEEIKVSFNLSNENNKLDFEELNQKKNETAKKLKELEIFKFSYDSKEYRKAELLNYSKFYKYSKIKENLQSRYEFIKLLITKYVYLSEIMSQHFISNLKDLEIMLQDRRKLYWFHILQISKDKKNSFEFSFQFNNENFKEEDYLLNELQQKIYFYQQKKLQLEKNIENLKQILKDLRDQTEIIFDYLKKFKDYEILNSLFKSYSNSIKSNTGQEKDFNYDHIKFDVIIEDMFMGNNVELIQFRENLKILFYEIKEDLSKFCNIFELNIFHDATIKKKKLLADLTKNLQEHGLLQHFNDKIKEQYSK